MSGIVGIVRTDGAAVDPALADRLTQSLAFRGPDAQHTWVGESVAFGHTLLRTTDESEHERQPLSLDGEVWIVADARVDARRDLVRELGDATGSVLLRAPDVELILRAYLQWGEACVEHLLGDFAFAIWDGRRQRLFCARDHMGVKPFYYAHLGRWFVFSNTLDCVRRHPDVSDRLHDLAIADFVLFGCNQDSSTTSFSDIKRLPPGHTLGCAGAELLIARYWTLPIEEPVYYPDDREYVERFRGLLREAVSDRLRTPRVSIFMSGGLDSPGLAATAADLLKAPDAVRAFTLVYDRLIPDSERHYAGMAARHLGVPIQFFAADEHAGWAAPGTRTTPEPEQDVLDPAPHVRFYGAMAAHSRVAFYGEGPDNALHYDWKPHLGWLAGRRRYGRLLRDVGKHLLHHKRIPLLPTVPRMLRDRHNRGQWQPVFPAWLDAGLVERLKLRDRWLSFEAGTPSPHPVRPVGYSSLLIPLWQTVFEGLEPPSTGYALEVRHPYVDVRVIRFLLTVPAVPWCREKHLVRCALRGVLPRELVSRPKTPLQKHPEYETAALDGAPPALPSPLLTAYGDLDRVPLRRPENVAGFHIVLRFVALSYWLRALDTEQTAANIRETMMSSPKKNEMPKKVYSSPALNTYGTLAQITTQVGRQGLSDHPNKGTNTRV